MAELTIRPEEIREALDRFVQSYTPETSSREEVGTVVTSGDGIARVEGLPSAMANELLTFENGTLGLALNLDVREIGVVVMGESGGIEEGQPVRRTGEILSVPVGDGYLGRTVDALGNPIDGLGDITDTDGRRALELQAALARQVGRDLVVQEVIDPDVLGGVRVELGDEVVEGTVAGRLDEARRLFGTG